jgi:hypothetical protein
MLLVSIFEARRRFHASADQGATFGVTYTVQQGQDLLTGRLLQDGVDHIWVASGSQASSDNALHMSSSSRTKRISRKGLVIRHAVVP